MKSVGLFFASLVMVGMLCLPTVAGDCSGGSCRVGVERRFAIGSCADRSDRPVLRRAEKAVRLTPQATARVAVAPVKFVRWLFGR